MTLNLPARSIQGCGKHSTYICCKYHYVPLKNGCRCKHHQVSHIVVLRTMGMLLLSCPYPFVSHVERLKLSPIFQQLVRNELSHCCVIMWREMCNSTKCAIGITFDGHLPQPIDSQVIEQRQLIYTLWHVPFGSPLCVPGKHKK